MRSRRWRALRAGGDPLPARGVLRRQARLPEENVLTRILHNQAGAGPAAGCSSRACRWSSYQCGRCNSMRRQGVLLAGIILAGTWSAPSSGTPIRSSVVPSWRWRPLSGRRWSSGRWPISTRFLRGCGPVATMRGRGPAVLIPNATALQASSTHATACRTPRAGQRCERRADALRSAAAHAYDESAPYFDAWQAAFGARTTISSCRGSARCSPAMRRRARRMRTRYRHGYTS